MKQENLDTKYLCIAENLYHGNVWGVTGAVMTLREWMLFLMGNNAIDYFDGYGNDEIVEYIRQNRNVKLINVGGRK